MATIIADDPHCMVLRPPDRHSNDLAVDALRKGEGMLEAWRRGPVEPPSRFERPLPPIVVAGPEDIVREDCPAFAGFHHTDGRSVALCKANGRHPELFHSGGAFDDFGMTTCGECRWHERFP
jgi:hypothetical protein